MTAAAYTLVPEPVATPTTRYCEYAMGMPISLALRGRHTDDHAARAAWTQVMAQLQRADEDFSTYRPDSYINRLDRGEIALSDCPPRVAEVLALGEAARQESAGAFNIRRPVITGRLRLDPTGVVKGWAVEGAAAGLEALPDTDFCLSAGGDMTCRTLDPASAPWRIGIEDPTDRSRIIAVVPVFTGAVATSGTAHRGQHLRDGRTHRIPTGVASVTVVTRSLTWADIDATAAYVQGRDAATWLRTRRGRAGLIVWEDGTTTTTGQSTSSHHWKTPAHRVDR